MKRPYALFLALLLCGCAAKAPALPAIVTPGPAVSTVIQGVLRGEGEPEEVVELDSEHGYWAYRTDTFGVRIECCEGEVAGGIAAWRMAEIAWLDSDPLELITETAEDMPEALAGRAGSVLFLAETAESVLIEGGEIAAGDGERLQRAGYGVLPDGGYIAIALSGSYEGESIGMTQAEFAALFLEAGCEEAVQLATGPAAAMVFMGVCVNDPFTGGDALVSGGVGWGRAAF